MIKDGGTAGAVGTMITMGTTTACIIAEISDGNTITANTRTCLRRALPHSCLPTHVSGMHCALFSHLSAANPNSRVRGYGGGLFFHGLHFCCFTSHNHHPNRGGSCVPARASQCVVSIRLNSVGCMQVLRLGPAVFTEVDAQASNLVNILMPND